MEAAAQIMSEKDGGFFVYVNCISVLALEAGDLPFAAAYIAPSNSCEGFVVTEEINRG